MSDSCEGCRSIDSGLCEYCVDHNKWNGSESEHLIYSDREKLGKMARKWEEEHQVFPCEEAVVHYLYGQGLINVDKAKQMLKCQTCGLKETSHCDICENFSEWSR